MPRDPELGAAGIDVLGAAIAAILEEGADIAAASPTSADLDEWLAQMRDVAADALIVSAALIVVWRRFGDQRG